MLPKRVCKACIGVRHKQYRQENRQALRDYADQYRQENRQARADYDKQRRRPPEYVAWIGMRQRCGNPRNKDYANYGGRGITVCPEWRDNFHRFLADIGPRPGPGYSLERQDVNGPYCPSNCRWATSAEQSNNKRANVISLVHGPDGPTYTAAELGRSMGMNPKHLRSLDLKWYRDGKPIPPLPYGARRRSEFPLADG